MNCMRLLNGLLKEIKFKDCKNNISKEDILNLVKLVLSENYFTFENNWYKQIDGLAMGSNISPILANIYLDHLYKETNNFTEQPIVFLIYVDDIFILWEKRQDFNNYFIKLNNLRPNN